jgi:hypothetical protein
MIRRLVAVLLIGVVSAAVTACNDDDPAEPAYYRITIQNEDSVAYEVWVDDNADADPDTYVYTMEGVVEANDTLVLSNRSIAVFYAIRVVSEGQDPNPPANEFKWETVITSNGPDINYKVPPTP